MSFSDDEGLLRLHEDYEVERWTAGDRDEKGNLIWHQGEPSSEDTERVRLICIDYDPEGEGNFRNIPVSPDRPLDPYGSNLPEYEGPHKGGRKGAEFYYDLDDLATNYWWSAFSP